MTLGARPYRYAAVLRQETEFLSGIDTSTPDGWNQQLSFDDLP